MAGSAPTIRRTSLLETEKSQVVRRVAHPPPRGIHPADAAVLGILAVVVGTLSIATLRGVGVGVDLALHAALLAGYAAFAALVTAHRGRRWSAHARGVAVIGVLFTLYTTLGHVAFDAVPWLADPLLARMDRWLLLGASPALEVAPYASPRVVEILSFFYAAYIPYLYLSIFLGLVGRPALEREAFVTGFALLYALSFTGYLFLPARGPVVAMASEFGTPLEGGPLHRLVVESIDGMGGPHGAMPSLHVGASCYMAWFDWRSGNRLRALIYLPLLILIAAATIVLRYHYVVDLLAGLALALLAVRVAPVLLRPSTDGAPGPVVG